jgi:hypothetical protein
LRDGVFVLADESRHQQALARPIGLGAVPMIFNLPDKFLAKWRQLSAHAQPCISENSIGSLKARGFWYKSGRDKIHILIHCPQIKNLLANSSPIPLTATVRFGG